MATKTKLEERNFVAFDSVVLDVDQIEGMAYGADEGTNEEIATIILESGNSVVIGGSTLEKFAYWWAEKELAAKVDMPATSQDDITSAIEELSATRAAPATAPVAPPTPAKPAPPVSIPAASPPAVPPPVKE